MNQARLIAIVTNDARHLADVIVNEPLSRDDEKVDGIRRLITGVMDNRKVTPLDLGLNSQYTLEEDGASIRFRRPDKGGVSQTMITITPRAEYKGMLTHDLGMAVSGSFVRQPELTKPKPNGPKAPTA